jgi:hypothetical protein
MQSNNRGFQIIDRNRLNECLLLCFRYTFKSGDLIMFLQLLLDGSNNNKIKQNENKIKLKFLLGRRLKRDLWRPCRVV